MPKNLPRATRPLLNESVEDAPRDWLPPPVMLFSTTNDLHLYSVPSGEGEFEKFRLPLVRKLHSVIGIHANNEWRKLPADARTMPRLVRVRVQLKTPRDGNQLAMTLERLDQWFEERLRQALTKCPNRLPPDTLEGVVIDIDVSPLTDLQDEAIAPDDWNEKLANVVEKEHSHSGELSATAEGLSGVTAKKQDEPEQQSEWAKRVRPLPTQDQQTPIQLNELSQAEAAADKLTVAGLKLVQQVLDSLVGRRAASPAEGKQIADRVRNLAKRFGAKLLYNNQPTYFKWGGADFKATTTDSSHEYLGGGVEFPQLTVQSLESEGHDESSGTPDSPHAARIQKSRSSKRSGPKREKFTGKKFPSRSFLLDKFHSGTYHVIV